MKNDLKYTALVLLLAQLMSLVYILSFWADADGFAGLGWIFLGFFVLAWFGGLIVATSAVLWKGKAGSRKRDRVMLIVIGTMTFFSVMITFGGIS